MAGPHTLVVVLLVAALACNGGGTAAPGNGNGNGNGNGDGNGDGGAPRLRVVASDLDFPVHLTAPPDDPRLFVVEKGGTVRIIRDGSVLPTPFLDLRGEVSTGNEQGLLSIAFHPDYAANGRFFVDYTDRSGDTQVVEFRVSGDPDRADPAPVRTILTVPQPFGNHNGGLVVFGPDGKFYVGLGDGGSGGDPQENGQNPGTLLGTILRLDVDAGAPYAIPPDNPFVDQPGARGEVWAYGLRNPWRFAFDPESGTLVIADVGQNRLEEVNAEPADEGGLNYGWDVMEGDACFEPAQGCDRTGLVLPVLTYDHDDGCSITGGHVYRGEALPELRGLYFYSDYCSGFIRSVQLTGGQATSPGEWPELEPDGGSVSSFGEDAAGELYILTAGGGVFQIVPSAE